MLLIHSQFYLLAFRSWPSTTATASQFPRPTPEVLYQPDISSSITVSHHVLPSHTTVIPQRRQVETT